MYEFRERWPIRGLYSAIAKGRHSEEILLGRLKMRDLVQKYNGILGLILSQNSTNHCKTSTSLQLSVSDMLTHVNFHTFAMADPRCGRLIRDELIRAGHSILFDSIIMM